MNAYEEARKMVVEMNKQMRLMGISSDIIAKAANISLEELNKILEK